MRTVAIDIETDSLEATKVWVIVCRDVDTDEVFIFERPDKNPNDFKDFCKEVKVFVGHYFLYFDLDVILSLVDSECIDPSHVIDTYVVSKLLNAKRKKHSIENYGEQLGIKKLHADLDISDFALYNTKVLQRCISDTDVTKGIFLHYKKYIYDNKFQEALRIEHEIARVCKELTTKGIPFRLDAAVRLRDEISARLDALDAELQDAFPPKRVLVKTIIPTLNKNGTINQRPFSFLNGDLTGVEPGVPYEVWKDEVFNPASTKQIIERLHEAGWKPHDKTKGHIDFLRKKKRDFESIEEYNKKAERFSRYGWKLNEDNLQTLPDSAPAAAHSLARRLLLASRSSALREWITWSKTTGESSSIHSTFDGIGTWTHRLATRQPNLQNIPVPQGKVEEYDDINRRMRELFYAPEGQKLIGTDASGIQMRIFAHYVQDKKLIDAVVGGDIHTLHQEALGAACKSRRASKTFIYAWLLGAGIAKVAEILECSLSEARDAVEKFLDFYPQLRELKKEIIPRDADRGYFEGLDGRYVINDSEHLMLSGYLQNGEAVVMKHACIYWRQKLHDLEIPFRLVNFVHDEWQTLVPDNEEIIKTVCEIQQDSIRRQAERFNILCPLDAESAVGSNWMETH